MLELLVEIISVPVMGLGAYGLYKVSRWQRAERSITGREGLIGSRGIVKRGLKPYGRRYKGKVLVWGEWWEAVGDTAMPVNTPIVVDAVDGFVLFVRESDIL